MPDQSSASTEHAIMQEITAPLATRCPTTRVPAVADADFPIALRGYDRLAVDAYVKQTSQLVAELQATRSPEAAIRRALERVGEQISGILQRAHETAEEITAQSRSEAEDRLEAARSEAAQIVAAPSSGSRISTPTPTGSGPSATGSSRTPASSRAAAADARRFGGAVASRAEAAGRCAREPSTEATPARARRRPRSTTPVDARCGRRGRRTRSPRIEPVDIEPAMATDERRRADRRADRVDAGRGRPRRHEPRSAARGD